MDLHGFVVTTLYLGAVCWAIAAVLILIFSIFD